MEHKLPPIYKNSFVGIWKRKMRGRPDQGFTILFFNENGSAYGPIGIGSKIGGGTVVDVTPDPNVKNKGILKVKVDGRPVEWNYTLNRNNDFKSDFQPLLASNRTPPVLNELFLVGQGARHLYAFYSHPFAQVMSESKIMQNVEANSN